MDERIRLLDEQGGEPGLTTSRTSRTLDKIGKATFSVIAVAVSLGMAVLPFLFLI